MKQTRVSLLENVGYSSWSISTLKRFAKAFDLTLRVSFESFGSRLSDINRFSREGLERFSFDEDPAFHHEDAGQLLQSTAARQGLTPSSESRRKKSWCIVDHDEIKPDNWNRYFATVPEKPSRQAVPVHIAEGAPVVLPSVVNMPLQERLKQVGSR
jgi:hypothetical protein